MYTADISGPAAVHRTNAYKDGRRVSEYIRLKDAERLGFSRPVMEKA